MAGECKKITASRVPGQRLSLKRNKGYSSPVEAGLRTEEAIREAGRCLATRVCEACDLCSLLCPDLCITRDQANGKVTIDLDFCKGCGICACVCPKGAIKMAVEE